MVNMKLEYANKKRGIGIILELTPNDIPILLVLGTILYKLSSF